MLEAFEGDINPGDIYALNDPFRGGMHLPDIFVFKPVFHQGEVVGQRFQRLALLLGDRCEARGNCHPDRCGGLVVG